MINEKPWGWYQTMDAGSSYKVKRIFVNPESRFSLQYHNHREEFWTIVEWKRSRVDVSSMSGDHTQIIGEYHHNER